MIFQEAGFDEAVMNSISDDGPVETLDRLSETWNETFDGTNVTQFLHKVSETHTGIAAGMGKELPWHIRVAFEIAGTAHRLEINEPTLN